MPREDCLKCALSQNNECGFDYSVLRWLINDEEQNKRSTEVHVTDITGCLRRAWYDKVDPSPEFPHAALARQIGSVIHKGLEGDDDALQSELADPARRYSRVRQISFIGMAACWISKPHAG